MRSRSLLTLSVLTLAGATALAQGAAAKTSARPVTGPAAVASSAPEPRTPALLANLEWRMVGPLNPTGRVPVVAGVEGDPRIVWVGAASGGVWKSEDGGVTFRPVFDEQDVHSIGDIAIAPSNPDVVYVGTGEGNPRNSVSPGGGVFKTTDGGKTWSFLGLEETRHIPRIVVDSTNPDVAYVAALGHVFGPNSDRGVFKTTDGGATWQKILFTDDKHGAADVDMYAKNPNLLFAGLWRFDRKPWTHVSGDQEGGLWRSVDAGKRWTRLTKGLPALMGRLSVRVAPSDSKVVYVIAETNEGTLFRSDDGGDTFRKMSDKQDLISRGLYYTQVRVHPTNPDIVFAVGSTMWKSIDGGKGWTRVSTTTHIDFHSLWIDATNPNRMWNGQDGGVAVTYDGGSKWEPIRNLPLAQGYQGFADTREPFYNLGMGLQDNGTWWGPSRTREPAGILEDDWRMPSFGDAFFIVTHPKNPDLMLSESQGGAIMKTDLRTRQQRDVSPQPERNDGGPVGALKYRFNWNAPIVPSPHDDDTVYFAGNVVFKSKDFGETWEAISGDLSTNDPDKLKNAGGPVWIENTTAEYHAAVISFAESAARAGVLWAGTDDGNLQVSTDAGKTWMNVIANVKEVPKNSPVSHVEPSRIDPGTAWVSFDRHMFDDYAPHVFKTTDFGKTFARVGKGIAPLAYVHALKQDPKNANLVYAGTERGLYASWDGGAMFLRMQLKNLPSTPVHDVFFQTRENDLILATHGRGLWILDDASPIQQFEPAAKAEVRLYPIRAGLRFPMRFTRYGLGDKVYKTKNPPNGAIISYLLPEDMAPAEGATAKPGPARVRLEILDGPKVIREIQKPSMGKGINRAAWDLKFEGPKPRKEGGDTGGSDFSPPLDGPAALPGRYTVRLTVDGKSVETPVEVSVDPLVKVSAGALRDQHELAARLGAMITEANLLLRGLDGIKVQLDERKKSLEALGRSLSKDAQKALGGYTAAHEKVFDRVAVKDNIPLYSESQRLPGRLLDLLSMVDDAFAAPTAAQREYAGKLDGHLGEAKAAYQALIDGPFASLNSALTNESLPALVRP
jgi:photosystem II stability/assembly factor-like uncharacterized protein